MRHAILWEVMDTSDASKKPDWNQDVFDLYEGFRQEALTERQELESSRLRGTKPALPLKSYVGTYSNDIIGDIEIELHGRALEARFPTVSWELKHWHLETFELTDEHGESVDFVTFAIDPSGAVASLSGIGKEFARENEE
jgi:hypothetical protein